MCWRSPATSPHLHAGNSPMRCCGARRLGRGAGRVFAKALSRDDGREPASARRCASDVFSAPLKNRNRRFHETSPSLLVSPHARGIKSRAALLMFSAAHAAAPQIKTQAPGYYRMMLGEFEITALSDGTVKPPVDQLLQRRQGEVGEGARRRALQGAGRDLGQRLPDQHRQQAGAGGHRRRRPVRPDAGSSRRQPA